MNQNSLNRLWGEYSKDFVGGDLSVNYNKEASFVNNGFNLYKTALEHNHANSQKWPIAKIEEEFHQCILQNKAKPFTKNPFGCTFYSNDRYINIVRDELNGYAWSNIKAEFVVEKFVQQVFLLSGTPQKVYDLVDLAAEKQSDGYSIYGVTDQFYGRNQEVKAVFGQNLQVLDTMSFPYSLYLDCLLYYSFITGEK